MAFEGSAERGLAYQLGSFALFISIAGIGVALAFQYIGGYIPCPLCLMQRYAYYAAIPALFLALALVSSGARGWAAAILFVVALAYLANTGLGVYHAGAEWKFWPGPDSCAGDQGLAANTGGLLKDLATIRVVRCDEASWRFMGLSFAGWNAVLSLFLMAVTLRAAFSAAEARRRSL
ncbi:MAG: disulfide bond formation protein B [Hyphomicrobium sp.]|nr:disulfide bond formation protein B [Hyphomicrobium sp.]